MRSREFGARSQVRSMEQIRAVVRTVLRDVLHGRPGIEENNVSAGNWPLQERPASLTPQAARVLTMVQKAC